MDGYYSKYLKYKQKYLELKKMIGGKLPECPERSIDWDKKLNPWTPKIFTTEELKCALDEYAKSKNALNLYCNKKDDFSRDCSSSLMNINETQLKTHLCVLGLDSNNQIWLGEFTKKNDSNLEFKGTLIYDYIRFNSKTHGLLNESTFPTGQIKTFTIQKSSGESFYGYIPKEDLNKVIEVAKEIRALRKEKADKKK
jgi:hypothetical protein